MTLRLFLFALTDGMSRPWAKLEPSAPPLRLLTPTNLASVLTQLSLAVATQVFIFLSVQRQPW